MMQTAIKGPVKITVKGPQGSGKSRLIELILDSLQAAEIEFVHYSGDTPKADRRWRKPYSKEAAKVMVVEKQEAL